MDKNKTAWASLQEKIEQKKNRPFYKKAADYLSEVYTEAKRRAKENHARLPEDWERIKSIYKDEYDFGKTLDEKWHDFKGLMAIKDAGKLKNERMGSERGDKDIRSSGIKRSGRGWEKDFARGATGRDEED